MKLYVFILLGCMTNSGVDVEIVTKLSEVLYQNNVYAQSFRMAMDILIRRNISDLKLWLSSAQKSDERIYNQPTVFEVAALIVGEVDT